MRKRQGLSVGDCQEHRHNDLGEEAEETGKALADPTIARVLEEFLAEQQARLKPGTLKKYEHVVHLFQSCMNGYAYQTLDANESKLFDRLYNAKGPAHREFCQVFGPDKIHGGVGEFLDYFMIRKVMCGKDLKQAAGTVMKKLGRWLGQKGYIDPDATADMAESGGEASKDLPAAEELANRLAEYADRTAPDCEEVIEDHFTIDRIEPGRLYLSALARNENLAVPVPKDLAAACRVGWSLSGAVGKTAKGWRLQEVWNVYP